MRRGRLTSGAFFALSVEFFVGQPHRFVLGQLGNLGTQSIHDVPAEVRLQSTLKHLIFLEPGVKGGLLSGSPQPIIELEGNLCLGHITSLPANQENGEISSIVTEAWLSAFNDLREA